VGKFGESGSFVLTEAEYREVVATMVALRRLGAELEEVFSEFAGAKEAPTRGAAAVVTSTDRVLDILYFRGERN
jgi:predicted transcriptional regulator